MSLRDDILRHHRNFATASWRIHDKCRDGISRSMPKQLLHNLDASGDARTKMLDSFRQIALVQVIWAHADFDELMHQFLHDMGTIVNMAHENRLIAQWHTGIYQPLAGERGLRRNFERMIEVRIDPDRVILPQNFAEVLGITLWKNDRRTRANANDFNMGNGTQVAQNIL